MPKTKRQHQERTAKLFMENGNQAVRLPNDFRFQTSEVFIKKIGTEVVLSPRPFDWTSRPVGCPGCVGEVHGRRRGIALTETQRSLGFELALESYTA